jgi:hypothetical protein
MAQPLLVGKYPCLTLLVTILQMRPFPASQLPFQLWYQGSAGIQSTVLICLSGIPTSFRRTPDMRCPGECSHIRNGIAPNE